MKMCMYILGSIGCCILYDLQHPNLDCEDNELTVEVEEHHIVKRF